MVVSPDRGTYHPGQLVRISVSVPGRLANNLSGIATIRAFSAEARESERVADASDRYRSANRNAIRLSSAFVPVIRLAILVGFTLTLVLPGSAGTAPLT
jgi:ATP-binding cassette subfamily B protein